jgi:Rrf2 family protein
MQITARLEYSVRALVALAAARSGTVRARDLADAQRIPTGYVYDILADLRRVDLVQVVHGPRGGYALSPAAATMTIAEILGLLQGAGPEVGYQPEDGLVARLHRLWTVAESAATEILAQVTLADLAREPVSEVTDLADAGEPPRSDPPP